MQEAERATIRSQFGRPKQGGEWRDTIEGSNACETESHAGKLYYLRIPRQKSEAHQGATSVARTLETDDVIDPADSRAWIVHGLDAAAVPAERGDGGVDAAAWRTRRDGQKRRPCVSPW